MRADLVFLNGTVVTVDAAQPRAEAVAVWRERIARVGSTAEVRDEIGPSTQVVDLDGRALLPGFVDAHAHPVWLGRMLSQIDVSPAAAPTLVGIQDAFRRAAATGRSDEWLLARGYDHFKLDIGRHPTRYELDAVTGPRPALLVRRCAHLAVANSAALELAEVGPTTVDPAGGQIVRDDRGEPTGLLCESAIELVRQIMPAPTRGELKDSILGAAHAFLSSGVCSAADANVRTSDELAAYEELALADSLPVRMNLMMAFDDTFDALAELGLRTGFGDEWLRIGPVKLFQDGSGGGGTAATRDPYRGDPKNHGITIYSQPELNRRVADAVRAGFQVATHGIGDRAIEMILDAYEAALRAHPTSDARLRIEHCALCTPEILERMQRLGVAACFQPAFLYHLGDSYLANFTDEQVALAYPARAWLDVGVLAAASSDAPVVPCDPLTGLRAAVTRKTIGGDTVAPAQAVSTDEAIRMYTLEAARVSFEESLKGSVTVGKLADLVVLDRDPRTVPPDELDTLRVELTMVGGRIAYELDG